MFLSRWPVLRTSTCSQKIAILFVAPVGDFGRIFRQIDFQSQQKYSASIQFSNEAENTRAAESEAGAPGQLMDTGPLLDTCTEHNFQNLKIVVDLFVGC